MATNDTPATHVAKDENDAVRLCQDMLVTMAGGEASGPTWPDWEVQMMLNAVRGVTRDAAIEEAAALCDLDCDRHSTRELADMIRALKTKEAK